IGGTATIDGNGSETILNGPITGGNVYFFGPLGTQIDPLASVFYLDGANSYGETRIGANVAVILEDGTLGTGNAVFEDVPSHPFFPASLVFLNTADYSFGGAIVGDGRVDVDTDPGVTITLTGSNTAA